MTFTGILDNCANGDGVVRRPRASDAIGFALRGAFGGPPRLPEDMRRLLNALDRVPRH